MDEPGRDPQGDLLILNIIYGEAQRAAMPTDTILTKINLRTSAASYLYGHYFARHRGNNEEAPGRKDAETRNLTIAGIAPAVRGDICSTHQHLKDRSPPLRKDGTSFL